MRKMTVLVMIGLVLILAVAVAVAGAMPDEGSSGRGSFGRGISTEKAIVDCLARETGGHLTRQELKELRVELALYGNREAQPAAMVACVLSDQVSTR